MQIVTIIKTIGQHFHVRFENSWFFPEFILKKMDGLINRAIEQPTNEPQSKHVFASQYSFVVHIITFETTLCERRKRSRNQLNGIRKLQFFERIIGQKTCLFEVFFLKRIFVENKNASFFYSIGIHF